VSLNPRSFVSPHSCSSQYSYVQELEARLIQMETLFKQVAPTLQQLGQLPAGIGPDGVLSEGPLLAAPPAIAQVLSLPDQPTTYTSSDPHGLDASQVIKIEDDEDDFAESQLAQDEHGSLRWMGNSSTMSLIHSFRSLTTDPQQRVQHRVSPGEGDARGTGANRLYFPASVFFGKIRALPGPEEVEYPDRDLADKLVRPHAHTTRMTVMTIYTGQHVLFAISLSSTHHRQIFLYAEIQHRDGQYDKR
jgi:hypothetical protein